MLKYSLKRILLAFITAFIIITLTFFLVKSLPYNGIVAPQEHTRWAFYVSELEKGYVIDCAAESPQYGALLEKFTIDGVRVNSLEHFLILYVFCYSIRVSKVLSIADKTLTNSVYLSPKSS